MTETSAFGVSRREGHNSTAFYARRLYSEQQPAAVEHLEDDEAEPEYDQDGWVNRIVCADSPPFPVPSNSVALAFTSPPYNTGKEYDLDLSLVAYLEFIAQFGREVYRCLLPGGRYVINIANLGRKPYIPMVAFFHMVHADLGFLPVGEIIWRKGKGANGSCAWGSWMSASAPNLRDVHEYLLVFAKESFKRPDKGVSDISREEFMEATLSVWDIPPESAKRIGHPAPFPLALAERVIRLYSYVGDVVLDPFIGSGTTAVAAKKLGRDFVGIEKVSEYISLAVKRLEVLK